MHLLAQSDSRNLADLCNYAGDTIKYKEKTNKYNLFTRKSEGKAFTCM